MYSFKCLLSGLLALLLWATQVQAKSVFAHFMLSNTAGFTVADYANEISLAQEAHIDGFAVNFAKDEATNDAGLPLFFQAAEQRGFKLFLSFDYAGNGAWDKGVVTSMIQKYAASSAYFHRGNQPLVSTFEGPKSAADWPDIKTTTNCFFIPSYSSLGAKRAMNLGVADGLFSWAAWAKGPNPMDTEVDASYLDFLGGKPYMMPVAPWFYTNMPGFSKNWLWKGDHAWFDRWAHVWYLQPEFVQIISWNDYGESHYIGPLDERQYEAFGPTRGNTPFNYARGMPHDGWRALLPFVIDTYKNNISTITRETLTTWYRLNPGASCSNGGTTGNTASQQQVEYSPSAMLEDRVFYSALLGSSAAVTVQIGGTTQAGKWDSIPDGGVGIYHGSVPFNGATGQVVVSLSRGGMSVSGAAITTDCSSNGGLNNWNAWVGSSQSGAGVSATPALGLGDQVCVDGFGMKEFGALKENFEGMCSFACLYGYCPRGPCTCSKMGAKVEEPKALNVDGYPAAGLTCTYKGLCAFSCNHDYCPAGVCTTDSALKDKCIIPPTPPEEPEDGDGTGNDGVLGCVSGTGEGNLQGLCDFSCGRGFCPSPCTCLVKGNQVPAAATKPIGYPLSSLGPEYIKLCAFDCARDYCPPSACTYTRPSIPGGVFKEIPTDDDGKTLDMAACREDNPSIEWICYKNDCDIAGNIGKSPQDRWNAVESQKALEDLMAWWEIIEHIREEGNEDIIPSWLVNMPVAAGWAWGSDPNGVTQIPTDYACDQIGKSGCNAIRCQDLTNSAVAMVEMAFGNLNAFYQKYWDAIGDVENVITDNAKDMADVFVRPKIGNFLGQLKEVLGAFDIVFAFAGAGFWEKALSEDAFTSWTKYTETADGVRGSISSSVDAYAYVGGTVSDAEADAIDAADSVDAAAKTMIDMLRKSINGLMSYLYSGETFGSQAMIDLLSNGLFVLNPSRDVSQGDVAGVIQKVIYSRLITTSWANDDSCAPVVIVGDLPAYNPQSSINFIGQWLYQVTVQYDDQQLTVVCVPSVSALASGNAGDATTANPPYGLSDISEDDNKWQVTWQELARSAYDGWKLNDKRLPFSMPKSSDTASGGPDSPTFLPLQQGISTPGFWQVPVCEYKKVADNLTWRGQKGSRKCTDIYPCCDVVCTTVEKANGGTIDICE